MKGFIVNDSDVSEETSSDRNELEQKKAKKPAKKNLKLKRDKIFAKNSLNDSSHKNDNEKDLSNDENGQLFYIRTTNKLLNTTNNK